MTRSIEEAVKNKYYTLSVDLNVNKKEAEKYLEKKLNCEVLGLDKFVLTKNQGNRYVVRVCLNRPIHGNTQNFRRYFESKLGRNNLVEYFNGVKK